MLSVLNVFAADGMMPNPMGQQNPLNPESATLTDNVNGTVATVAINSAVNFRRGPGKDYEVIGEITVPSALLAVKDIYYSATDGLYFGKTVWNGQVGWISLRQTRMVHGMMENIAYPDFYTTVASTDGAINFRAGTDMNAEIIGEIPNGTRLHVTDMLYNNTDKLMFGYVAYNNTYGWISLRNTQIVRTGVR